MPDQVGKYRIRKTIGKGASGTVYLALDSFSEQEVALKVINPAIFRDREFGEVLRAQFLNEASLAGKLSHPHIVAILDAVVEGDSGYIAMEYVPGGSLSRRTVPDSLLVIEDAVQIGFKCCGALDYAFREGIVHRDIKPGNVMVVEGTEVKIADFGAAHLHKRDVAQTANIGTPSYMSPEQIRGGALGLHSDMYCLGVMLYELLTGHKPFVAASVRATWEKVLYETPEPPSRHRGDVPPELDEIVMTALRKKPEERYPSWVEFALELAKVGRLGAREQAIPDSEKYAALKRVAMLASLTEPEIWELAKAGRWTRLDARVAIIREDEPGESLFFLAKGELKVTKRGRLLNIIREGECFGEMSLIAAGELPRQATVESLTEVVLAEFERAALERMSPRCHLRLLWAILRNVVDRLALADVRLAQAG